MIDPTTLVRDLVPFLAPALPYLLKGGEMVVEGATKKIGEDAWKWTKALWDKLRPKVEAKPAALEAVQDVAAAPDNEDALAALRLQLKKLLAEDEALAGEVARLWEEARQTGVTVIASGERSVAAQKIEGSTIITGDRNTVLSGKREESDER